MNTLLCIEYCNLNYTCNDFTYSMGIFHFLNKILNTFTTKESDV